MNLTIPDAAAALGVSETRLRKALSEHTYETVYELRQTRTGMRKATMLPPATIAELRDRICGFAHTASIQQDAGGGLGIDCEFPASDRHAESEGDSAVAAVVLQSFPAEPETADIMDATLQPERPQRGGADPPESDHRACVPESRFNALLYQHNVLREEFTRVTEYLDDCDRLLGEMVKTLAALEARTREAETPLRAAPPPQNALSATLNALSRSFRGIGDRRSTTRRILKPAEVYYANALTGRQ